LSTFLLLIFFIIIFVLSFFLSFSKDKFFDIFVLLCRHFFLFTSPPNVATVAYANKLARIAWAIMMHGNRYNPALAFTIIS